MSESQWNGWVWPWEGKQRTAAQALIGLGRMQDRLMRRHVWVYQGPDKYKPVLRQKKGGGEPGRGG